MCGIQDWGVVFDYHQTLNMALSVGVKKRTKCEKTEKNVTECEGVVFAVLC